MRNSLLITDVRLLDPAAHCDTIGNLLVLDGRVADPGTPCPPGIRRLDGRGLAVAPGFWDLHVHFRDPGGTVAEDLHSGATAAARGGFTHVVTMPNTIPPCDTPEAVRRQATADLPVRILPSACLTRGRLGREPADLAPLAAAGAMAFTDDGSTVSDDAVMAESMRRAAVLGRLVMDHAIDPSRAGAGMVRECATARRLGLPILWPEAEVEAVRRDIALCRETGCRLHVQHISCAGSLACIAEAQCAGLPVSGEASPHHLALSAEEITGDDGNYRMNPPLGSRDDMLALRRAVCDGTVAAFATDHAPHAPETKNQGFRRAPAGVIGLETAIGVTYTVLVEQSGLTPLDWVARWTVAPSRLLGLPAPSLTPGTRADLVLLDLTQTWQVEPAAFSSRSRNCPFAGWALRGQALLTMLEGRITWRTPRLAAS